MFTHKEAIEAIQARINGVWDNPQLCKIGDLAVEPKNDILLIIESIIDADQDSGPQKLHVLPVIHNTGQVQITSDYWDETITVPYTNEPGSKVTPEIDTAEKYLLSKGFKLLGASTGKGQHYIVASNYQHLK